MPRALKVYRTHIGFFDMIVAAHSQKEALAAWGGPGSEFQKGFASVTTDEKATSAALKNPGKVLYRLFGSDGPFSTERTLPKVSPHIQREIRESEREKKVQQKKSADKKAAQARAEEQEVARETARREREAAHSAQENEQRERTRALANAKQTLQDTLKQLDAEERTLKKRRADARAEYEKAVRAARR
jgi:hypothetical protein